MRLSANYSIGPTKWLFLLFVLPHPCSLFFLPPSPEYFVFCSLVGPEVPRPKGKKKTKTEKGEFSIVSLQCL